MITMMLEYPKGSQMLKNIVQFAKQFVDKVEHMDIQETHADEMDCDDKEKEIIDVDDVKFEEEESEEDDEEVDEELDEEDEEEEEEEEE
ncbi:hypothetical protein ADUPG1_006224, partial [Aduncisulcus paluster]